MEPIYKIATAALWEEAKAKGLFTGAPIDLAECTIRFSADTNDRLCAVLKNSNRRCQTTWNRLG